MLSLWFARVQTLIDLNLSSGAITLALLSGAQSLLIIFSCLPPHPIPRPRPPPQLPRLVDILRAIPQRRIEALRRGLARVWERFTCAATGYDHSISYLTRLMPKATALPPGLEELRTPDTLCGLTATVAGIRRSVLRSAREGVARLDGRAGKIGASRLQRKRRISPTPI